MSQTLTWNAGPVSMAFEYADGQPVVMRALEINGVSVQFPESTPIAEVMTTDTGHMISCNKLRIPLSGENCAIAAIRPTPLGIAAS